MGQKATDQTLLGEHGIAMIAGVCSEMKHIWRPEGGATDFGIDGHIELRDPATKEVRNYRIGVQSRATTGRWPGETDTGFYYLASKKHIDFWMSGTQPVLLVCSRPHTNEIYARSIQDWAADPAARASRRVAFIKERDRFDATFRDRLFNLKIADEDHVDPPGPAWEAETLTSNLMPIIWHAEELYSAEVPSSDAKALLEPAHRAGVHDFAAVLRDGMVWSLGPFRAGFLDAIGATAEKRSALEMWFGSDAAPDLNLIRDLVRRRVISDHHQHLLWHYEKRLVFFRLRYPPDAWKPVSFKWSRGAGRTVVSPRESTTHDGYSGYRHDAAELGVRRIGRRWFVQVKPTYLFTWDGYQVSGHHDEALSGIKRRETHPAVSQALRMWEHCLVEKLRITGGASPMTLHRLQTVTSPRSFQDGAWKSVSARDLGIHRDPELALFDPDVLEV